MVFSLSLLIELATLIPTGGPIPVKEMSYPIFSWRTHICSCPRYGCASTRQTADKIPTCRKKMLMFREIGFKIKGHNTNITGTCNNWLLQFHRFWKQTMLVKSTHVVSSLSTSTQHSRRYITGGVALLLLFLNFVSEASGNNLTSLSQTLYDCEDVSNYYSSLEGLEGTQLMEKLHTVISLHHSIPYNQVWDALGVLDAADIEHPRDSPDVIEIYSHKSVPKILAGKLEGWNREHLWPRSYGLMTESELTDLHNLRPADVNVNSSRGNKYYGECVPSHMNCLSPANPEAAPDTASDKESWMPPAKVRGDIARATMYMAICYGFDQPPQSLNLQLSDSPSMANARMGLLSVLMRWHEIDPPSRSERLRNDTICKAYQNNRNPFVDHPEYATLIWAHSGQEASVSSTSKINGSAFLQAKTRSAWINELHYENKGKDKNEFLEVVVGSSVDPSKLKLLLYNGANGKCYSSLSLSNSATSSVADPELGYSIYTIYLPADSLQNGPADGIALVEEGKKSVHVIQFLSYEGVVEAVEGPAQGLVSQDIVVSESKASSAYDSLGLTGSSFENFHWTNFVNGASPGKLNKGQNLILH